MLREWAANQYWVGCARILRSAKSPRADMLSFHAEVLHEWRESWRSYEISLSLRGAYCQSVVRFQALIQEFNAEAPETFGEPVSEVFRDGF